MIAPNLSNEVLENAIMVHETCEKAGMEMQPLDAVAVQAMKELLQYRAIGTVEECREAVDRLKPKKPILKNGESGMFVDYADGHGEYKVTKWQDWVCPVCGWFVGQRYNAIRNGSKPHPHDQRKCEYCNRCGARIDWSDNG